MEEKVNRNVNKFFESHSQEFYKIFLAHKVSQSKKVYGVIYKLIDNEKNKVYIGQTIQRLRVRFRDHLKAPANEYLSKAIKRYNRKYNIVRNGRVNGFMSYRTKYSAFSIEVIDTASDFIELNSLEIKYIEKYKSYIPKYGNKYGYNIQKGGDALIHHSGEDHWRWISIDDDILIKYIKRGLLLKEIAAEFGVSISTIERRIRGFKKKFGVKNITKARKLFGGAEKAHKKRSEINRSSHPYVKEINEDEFLDQIRKLKTVKEIYDYLGIGHKQFYDMLNDLGYNGLEDARKDLNLQEDWRQKRAERRRKILYSNVSKEELKKAIKAGLILEELKSRYDMGDIQFYDRLKEIGFNSLPMAREKLGGNKNLKFRQFIRYNLDFLKTIFPLLKKSSFHINEMVNLVDISKGGVKYQMKKNLKPFNIVQPLRKRGFYRVTDFGKEFLSNIHRNNFEDIKIGGIKFLVQE